MTQSALQLPRPAGVAGVIATPLLATAERLSGLKRLDALYRRAREQVGEGDFLDTALATLGVEASVDAQHLAQVPDQGPLVIVANHPFGGVEGMALAQVLRRRRPDLRILANHLLGRIPELDPLMIHVDPFGGAAAARRNRQPLRQALAWLDTGGALLVFPAGAVSHWHLTQRAVTDPPWQPAAAWLARRSQATVLPVFIGGRNSTLFQLAGLVSAQLRTALLVRELLNSHRRPLHVEFGRPIVADALGSLGDDAACTAFLRLKVYALARRQAEPARRRIRARRVQTVVAGLPAQQLAAEVAGLPSESRLLVHGDFAVYLATAEQIPHLLQEIGRLRELTFRAAGEGTGKATDIDRYDAHYLHLWLWDQRRQRVVGAYRLAPIDRVLATHGPRGLYIASLFRFQRGVLGSLGAALELGRSFVAADYQRDFQPLLLLWQGIGRYLIANPHYTRLLGPVSVARSYCDASRSVMAQYLGRDGADSPFGGAVRGNFRPRPKGVLPASIGERLLRDMDAVASLVSAIEDDGKSLPVLLRHYLKLNGEVLAWNVDRDFGDVLDALLLVDLRRTDPRLLRRYMGADGAAAFLALHAPAAAA
ncbi:MAG: lysophospholipid acyltransferase family protein [Immundisolibacter sp.]|uniref:lysophospholipid acyltransferase family protein n=1 Tax=Immundisolibacter sp. TaxID=1934948 RepID=UPI003D0AB3FD